MKALYEIPPEIVWFCPEEKVERRFILAEFVRNGVAYRCEVCGRLRIFTYEELDYIVSKMRP